MPAIPSPAGTTSLMPRLSPAPTCPRFHVGAEGGIGRIAIVNPERRNAIDLAMWQALPSIFAGLQALPGLRVLVVTGSGTMFSAGADLSEFSTARATPALSRAYEEANVAAFEAVAEANVPVIAAINGPCLGAGLGLALACDLRIGTPAVRFAIPAARLGVGYPPRALATAVSVLGAPLTRELFFTGRMVEAEEARQAGLVNRLVPREEFEAALADLCAQISAGAPLTLAAAKRAIDRAAALPHAPDLAACQALADACFESADCAEGLSAFLGKRPPIFTGR